MKKLLLMVAAVAALAFTGCSKDEDKAESLVGTVWEFYEEYDGGGYIEYYSAQLHFTTSSDVKITEKYSYGVVYDEVETAMAKYSYNHPIVVIYENDAWDEQRFILKDDGRRLSREEELALDANAYLDDSEEQEMNSNFPGTSQFTTSYFYMNDQNTFTLSFNLK